MNSVAVTRLIFHTASPDRFPARADPAAIERMLQAILPQIVGFTGEVIVGSEDAPLDEHDGLLLNGVRRHLPGARLGVPERASRPTWDPEDDYRREHPCPLPFAELAFWVDGSVYVCREQYPHLGDRPQGDWRRQSVGDLLDDARAASFRERHARPGVGLPASCSSCIHPAVDWQLAMRSRLRRYRSRHAGERCFVLGNGPSLTDLPLERLEGEVTFGANRIHEAYGAGLPPVTYFCCSDPRVWRELGNDWRPSRARAAFLRHPDVPLGDPDAIYLVQHDYDHAMCDGWFPRDPAQGLARGRSVLLDLALPLAHYMGFDEVILIGCDFSWNPEADNHFYRDRDEPWPLDVPRSRYLPPFEMQLAGFEVARRAFESDGRRLLNATPDGGLTVLPRVDFDSLFGKRTIVT